MKIKEINFDMPIEVQLEELEARSLIKNHTTEQRYAFLLLAIPIHQRSLLQPSDQEKLELGPVEALKRRIRGYYASITRTQTQWTIFLNEKIKPGKRIKEYANRILLRLKAARRYATEDDIIIFIKPKIVETVPKM